MSCTPADLVALSQNHRPEAHAGTTLPSGSLISSPSGVKQWLSSMSTGFSLIGRVAPGTPDSVRLPAATLFSPAWRAAIARDTD
ncbi:TPA: hypothetical protein ACH3X2_006663 [Trebouxia sp. C0005]